MAAAAVVLDVETDTTTPQLDQTRHVLTVSQLDAAEAVPMIHVQRGNHQDAMLYLTHLREWRTYAGMTQFELSIRSDVEISTISRLERQVLRCRLGVLGKLARALGISNWRLATCAPTPDVNVVPPERVQLVERDNTLRFYVETLYWRRQYNRCIELDELETLMGIDMASLKAIEEQRQPATMAQVEILARAFDCTILDLVRY